MKSDLLPTGVFGSWTVTSFRDSLIDNLRRDTSSDHLRFYFYAVTLSGWEAVREPVQQWRSARRGRSLTMYAGTDHGITDPDGLSAMSKGGVSVRVMQTYSGVYHPKVAWLSGANEQKVWVGSNNLTRDGLRNNIEFAVLVRSEAAPAALVNWAQEIDAGSVPIDDEILRSYRNERAEFERNRATAKATTFTWSQRAERPQPRSSSAPKAGDLVFEIMPEETRGGNQVQLPKEAARQFFGLGEVGDQIEIQLKQHGSSDYRSLLVSVFANNTIRLSINELEYRDRPCVVVLRRITRKKFAFEIVSESVFPSRYKTLLAACKNQTRTGSRRWTIVPG